VKALVNFAGLAPGFAGLCQVNIVVPPLTPGQYPLQIAANGVLSNSALIDIQ
jgi:adhesin/invasin